MRAALQKNHLFPGAETLRAGRCRGGAARPAESAAIGISPRYVALATFWQGEIAFGKGRYDTAAQLYERFLSRAPRTEREYALAYYNLGYCRFLRKQMPAAGEQFDRFLKLYPADDDYRADALNRRGDVHYATRRFEQALQCYTAAAASDRTPRYYAQYRRALMLGILGQPARKIEALRAIVAADRGDYAAEAAYELGRTHLGLEQYRESAAVLERFVGQYPHSPHRTSALSDLGLIYANLGDRKRSLEYYDRVVQTAPTSSGGSRCAGRYPRTLRRRRQCRRLFRLRRAERKRRPLGPLARLVELRRRPLALYLADRTEDAARSLRSYVKSFPQGPTSPTPSTTSAPATAPPGRSFASWRRSNSSPPRGRTSTPSGRWSVSPRRPSAQKRYATAAEADKRLSECAPTERERGAALERYVRALLAAGDREAILAAGDVVESRKEATPKRCVGSASPGPRSCANADKKRRRWRSTNSCARRSARPRGPKRCTASSSRSSARATTRRPRR